MKNLFLESLASENFEIPLGHRLAPLSFRNFLLLEEYKSELSKAIGNKNANGFSEIIKKILSLYSVQISEDTHALPVLESILLIFKNNHISEKIVFLKEMPEEVKKSEPLYKPKSWDYDGRFLTSWINDIAKAYHWTLDYIMGLPTNTVLFLLQEIFISNFEDREWNYSLTEMAYTYDKDAKKSRFNPLQRPFWLRDAGVSEIKKEKMLKSLMPSGVIIDSGGMGIYGEKAK